MSDDIDADLATGEVAEDAAPEAPTLVYGNCVEFFDAFLRRIYVRTINGRDTHWSARWWESAEAIYRIDALWRSWEALRLDAALGASSWLRDHMDYHMGVLTSATGPFANDDTRHNAKDGPLPHEAPPEGMFPDERGTA